MPARRTFGSLRALPSGKIQARYLGPDRHEHKAPNTFTTKTDANRYLATVEASISAGTWQPLGTAKKSVDPFGEYAATRLAQRALTPRTHESYQSHFNRGLLPRFADLELTAITPQVVREWFAGLPKDEDGQPKTRPRMPTPTPC